jgi:hypothetical protein
MVQPPRIAICNLRAVSERHCGNAANSYRPARICDPRRRTEGIDWGGDYAENAEKQASN